ncbi:LuxR family transcriptional regulator [Actinomadura sp. 7K507]|uniref:ATP-binding protein n=1 Tax=Actinomadura sp. 7K507 TaxID=2530365 RepID=UPI001049528B|nr:LuxR family transcriptional regulator [Actinomadura sp. 7K507]TDC94627.1 helix-turn-helix transcriptional regulator [Actinomadura sp. 7K507]
MVDLVGRRVEREAVEHLLNEARAGRSGSLVVRGEAGIGKTALLEHARALASSSGFRVASAVGVESEAQFAFGGLHQLCAPLLDRAEVLPDPQRAALNVAFGQQAGPAPDRFLIGLAVLNLLAEVAEDGPMLCLIDDAQWLDEGTAQVMAFAARRVAAERLAMMVLLRDPTDNLDPSLFAGLPELRVDRLSPPEAWALLAAAVPTPLDQQVRERVIAEARGNPLALLELSRSASPTHLAGGFALPDAMSLPLRIEAMFQRRSRNLPVETQLLLLVAAAEPTGDAELLWRAAAELGIARESGAPAEVAGLVTIDMQVRFRHPCVRSAVYRAANPPDRRRAHAALAVATESRTHPDRKAWHRAQAVQGTDEEAAAGLERSAGRARARGGLAAAAAFLQQAADLTPEPADRARRALEAASAKHEVGDSAGALALLEVAAAGPLNALQSARSKLLRAQLAFHLTRRGEVPGLLLGAARTLAPLDAALSRETYLQSLDVTMIIGGRDDGHAVREVAEAARSAPPPAEPPTPADLLLDGLVAMYTHSYAAGVPELRRALEATCHDGGPAQARGGGDSRWLWLAARAALTLYDDELLYALAQQNVRVAREAGALSNLPAALLFLASVSVLAGESARASELIAEEAAITNATGGMSLLVAPLLLAAWRGSSSEVTELHATFVREATARGSTNEVAVAQHTLAVLHNGLGNYAEALDFAEQGFQSLEPPHVNLVLPELVEAAARTAQPERAAYALEQLTLRATASGTPWGLGLAARSRALVTTGSEAEELYREAIEQLRGCRMTAYLARTHLVYGEALRREGRRREAREQLRTAHDLLSDIGAEAFAARAARELRAAGEHPRKRAAQPTDALTPQELHIARLVATGATSREVAAQLFLSPRTIEAHLRNIFGKLGITSRRQLKELSLP